MHSVPHSVEDVWEPNAFLPARFCYTGQLTAQRTFAGNRPSTTILLDALTPESLGALLALYEHKVFVQSVLWGINAFDQWGVELGKTLAKAVLGELRDGAGGAHDPSTAALIKRLKR